MEFESPLADHDFFMVSLYGAQRMPAGIVAIFLLCALDAVVDP